MNKRIYRQHIKTRIYSRLFPKNNIYREINPTFIPILSGQNPSGYGDEFQDEIEDLLVNLKSENSGTLPHIVEIGSYSSSTGMCIVCFKNTGKYSPKWFADRVK